MENTNLDLPEDISALIEESETNDVKASLKAALDKKAPTKKAVKKQPTEKVILPKDTKDEREELVEAFNIPTGNRKRINLADFQINKATNKEKVNILETQVGGRSTHQITCIQSGYMCKISALTPTDMRRIMEVIATTLETKKLIFEIVYKKITEFSCGHLTFEEFLEKTVLTDLETLYYGLYCITFPGRNKFTFPCPNEDCNHEDTYLINVSELLTTKNPDRIKAISDNISKTCRTKEDVGALSLLAAENDFQIGNANTFGSFKAPTLQDMLDILSELSEDDLLNYDDNDLYNFMTVKKFFIERDGSLVEYSSLKEIRYILENVFDLGMLKEVKEIVAEILATNRVEFIINSIKCNHCKQEAKNIAINLENILFTQAFEIIG